MDFHRCEWFSFDESNGGCFFLSDCALLDEECLTCVSGQSKCGSTKGKNYPFQLI